MAKRGRPTKEEQRTRKAESVPTRMLYTTKEVCILLNCGTAFLKQIIDEGLIRYVPRGRYRYISAEAIRDYINAQEQCNDGAEV